MIRINKYYKIVLICVICISVVINIFLVNYILETKNSDSKYIEKAVDNYIYILKHTTKNIDRKLFGNDNNNLLTEYEMKMTLIDAEIYLDNITEDLEKINYIDPNFDTNIDVLFEYIMSMNKKNMIYRNRN